MSRADELRIQYESKIAGVGQWVAIRRYSGPSTNRTYVDTLTRAYVRYYGSTEFVGAVTQGDLTAIALVDTLGGILPVTTNDKLVTSFFGFDVSDQPPLDEAGHVTGGKETAIKSMMKRVPGGTLIAIELHAVG
jgi:hypothetical protein